METTTKNNKGINEERLAQIRERSLKRAREWQKWLEDNGMQETPIY